MAKKAPRFRGRELVVSLLRQAARSFVLGQARNGVDRDSEIHVWQLA